MVKKYHQVQSPNASIWVHGVLKTGKNWNLCLKSLLVCQVLCLNLPSLQKNKKNMIFRNRQGFAIRKTPYNYVALFVT